uniref:Death domain-containing protein n=1 Tax=Amphimedon queenslandica TaxID=400682 RepID=A0A1X7T0E3_AMPQE
MASQLAPSVLSGRTLSIQDLDDVISLLERHDYSKTSYRRLGLRLKLHHNTLETIRKDHGDIHPCFTECLASWLRKADRVKNPTIDALIAALRGIGENAVADGINEERKRCTMSESEVSDCSSDRPMLALATPPTLLAPSKGEPVMYIVYFSFV